MLRTRETIAAKASNAYNIVSPVCGHYGSNLGNLWPLAGNTKERKVSSGYRDSTLDSHARILTTVPPPSQTLQTFIPSVRTDHISKKIHPKQKELKDWRYHSIKKEAGKKKTG